MFKRILVPTDGRAGADAVIRFAARLARAHRAEIVPCYVVDGGLIASAFVSIRDTVRRELQADGQQALRRASALCRRIGVGSRDLLLEGDVADEIAGAARRVRADLLVMRTTGRGPLASLLLGSPAPAIVRRVPCPVLLLGPATARRRPRATRGASRRKRS